MQRRLFGALFLLLGAVSTACGLQPSEPLELGTSSQEIQAKAGTYTVYMNDWAEVTPGAPAQLVLSGTSSRNLGRAFSWVPDDAFGLASWDLKQLSVTLRDGHEINTVLSGAPLFIRLEPTTGTPAAFEARVTASPAFANRSGTTAMSLAQSVTPVMVRDPEDPLRYRVTITMNRPAQTAEFVLPDGARVVGTNRTNGVFTFDLTFSQVYAALGQSISIEAHRPEVTYTKYAVMTGRVQQLAVTSEDPYVVWPEVCEPAVRTCLEGQPEDLATCGTYYQVSRCRAQNPCILEPEPMSLVELPDAGLTDAAAAYTLAGNRGYTWASLTATGYEVVGCGVTLADVVDHLATAQQGAPSYVDGELSDRTELENSIFCTSSYSSAGPQVLQAIDAFAPAWQMSVWKWSSEVPCHNCTSFEDRMVIHYPQSRRVIVLVGGHGYDS